MKRTIVLVTWHDAHAETEGWASADEVDNDPCVVQSVGFLMPEAKRDHIVIAQSLADDDDGYHLFSIPVGMVRSMQVM